MREGGEVGSRIRRKEWEEEKWGKNPPCGFLSGKHKTKSGRKAEPQSPEYGKARNRKF